STSSATSCSTEKPSPKSPRPEKSPPQTARKFSTLPASSSPPASLICTYIFANPARKIPKPSKPAPRPPPAEASPPSVACPIPSRSTTMLPSPVSSSTARKLTATSAFGPSAPPVSAVRANPSPTSRPCAKPASSPSPTTASPSPLRNSRGKSWTIAAASISSSSNTPKTSLEQVRFAKKLGLHVTCEVTPHHFTLIDEDVTYDSRFKMNPPLAAGEDREALLAGLADGTVDAIATDHAPHEPAIKDVEFDKAPFGILGFDTAIGLALEQLVHTNRIPLMRMVELFTTGPARVLGKERKLAPGEPADLTIFSVDRPWTYK